MPSSRLFMIVFLVVGIPAGISQCTLLWEMDIFWQIRAGMELWQQQAFPQQDTWSFSVPGQPWMNIQWLSTLLFAGIYSIGQEPAMIVARAILTVIWLLLITILLKKIYQPRRSTDWPEQVIYLLIGLCWALMCCWLRLQIRSDLLVLLSTTFLMYVWQSPWRHQDWLTLALTCFAANCHAGTAPFTAVIGCYFLWQEKQGKNRFKWILACLSSMFITPYHVRVIPLLWAHLNYRDYNKMQNPDHLNFLDQFPKMNWESTPGIVFVLAVLIFIWHISQITQRQHLPRYYQSDWVTWSCFTLLLALSLNRTRAMPYAFVWMLPVLAKHIQQTWSWKKLYPYSFAIILLCITSVHIQYKINHVSFEVDDQQFPIGSAAFVRNNRPKGNVLHTFTYGAYLVWHLKEYPIYVDTRETIYWSLQDEILGAYQSPEVTMYLLNKYNISTVIMPIPDTRYIGHMEFENITRKFMPEEDWKLVYLDRISFVMVKNIPEHQELIAKYQYHLLQPNLPANLPVDLNKNLASPDYIRQYEEELHRCIETSPKAGFCWLAKTCWWRKYHPDQYQRHALEWLAKARNALSPRTKHQLMTFQMELIHAYNHLGMKQEAEQIQKHMEQSFSSL